MVVSVVGEEGEVVKDGDFGLTVTAVTDTNSLLNVVCGASVAMVLPSFGSAVFPFVLTVSSGVSDAVLDGKGVCE